MKKLLEYVQQGYFEHYNLYKYIFTNNQMNEEIKMTVFVDTPSYVPPLSESLFMGKSKFEIKDDEHKHLVSAVLFCPFLCVDNRRRRMKSGKGCS